MLGLTAGDVVVMEGPRGQSRLFSGGLVCRSHRF